MASVRARFRETPKRGAVLAATVALLLTACFEPGDAASVSVPDIEAFLGTPLPPGIRDLHAADEAGIDRLMRLRFDAPTAEARAFAARLVPGGLRAGEDPGIAYLGSDLDWWIAAPIDGSVGGEAASDTNRVTKLVAIPVGSNMQRLWIAAFTK